MDTEKLIERLKNTYGECYQMYNVMLDAATALSTLQDENEKLRAEMEQKSKLIAQQAAELERRDTLLKDQEAELERVKRERDAVVDCCSGYCASCLFVKDCAKHDMNDAAPTRWYYGDCEDWEWRGQKED